MSAPSLAPLARALPALAALAALVLVLVLAGCTVGPDFQRPAAPTAERYTRAALAPAAGTAGVAGGEAQRFVGDVDLPGDWWTLFRSPALNALVAQALANNHDLKAAQAALRVAQETALAQRGAFYPSVSASLAATRSKTSAQLSPTPNSGALTYSLYTPQLSVSYLPDVFGLNRRTLEAVDAQAHAAHFEWVAAQTALSANVVAAAIGAASLEAQIDVLEQVVAIDTRSLAVVRTQAQHGYASRLDVAAQEVQLAQTTAALPPLRKALAQQRDLLAALCGALPSEAPDAAIRLDALTLPSELPLTLPSRLVEQRPDVRAAEETLHAASAGIGIAAANRLPTLALSADLGRSALSPERLFGAGTLAFDVGANLLAPIAQGGALEHKERAARAAFAQAEEQYRSTVVVAFQNVADSLEAIEHDADALRAASAAADAAHAALDLARRQQQAGYATTLQVLAAEQAALQSGLARVTAQASRYADTAALFEALGGGWWTRTGAAPTSTAARIGAP